MDFRKMGGVGYVHKVENIKTQHALQELAATSALQPHQNVLQTIDVAASRRHIQIIHLHAGRNLAEFSAPMQSGRNSRQ